MKSSPNTECLLHDNKQNLKKATNLACVSHSSCFSFLPLSGGPVQDGRCDQRDRRPDDLPAQPRAAGLEAKAADRRHRRSAAHQPGPTAELVTEGGFFGAFCQNMLIKLKMDSWRASQILHQNLVS